MFIGVMVLAVATSGMRDVPSLRSPDGRVEVAFDLPSWSIDFNGRRLFEGNRLGLSLKGEGDMLQGATLVDTSGRSVDKEIRVLFGRASRADDHYNERRLAMRSAKGRRFDVVFRCFGDAVAFRYEVPAKRGEDHTVVVAEETSFRAVGSPTAYVQYLESYTTSHEHEVDVAPLDQVRKDALLDTPLTLVFGGDVASITEANLRRYAGMGLRKAGDRLVSDLTPRPDGTKAAVKGDLFTPWRVVLVADDPGRLLESNTVYCLADPNEIGETGWIHPGKMTWPWWNGNVVDDGKAQPPIFSLEAQKKYIDFAADSNVRYHSVIADNSDTPWYHQNSRGLAPSESTDVTRVRDDLDLEAVRAYADRKGVKLWTWVHSGALRGHVDEAFAAFEKLGWSGMMVDFFDHDDQDTVELAEHILRAAAKHHILIHFHGIWKPTGLQRTFPNLMNHEGSLNEECMKWGDRVTPTHTLKLLFTRMVAGPMDYHLGGFRAVRPQDFKVQNISPLVEGTRCFMLASYVCMDNPNPMVADYPDAYRGQPGFDFLKAVPTYWDETRVLLAEPGRLIVTARRKGKEWWIGGMSAGPARTVEFALPLQRPGSHRVSLWEDALDDSDPNQLKTRTFKTASTNLQVRLAEDGGFVARVTP